MLLSESELNMYNADSILDEAVLLDESESIIKLPAIPVVENSRLGGEVVNLSDLDNIVEDYDCSYEDAFYNIAEQNELDPSNLMVAVEDYSIIETPELVDLVPNIVVKPISENNIVYQAVDYCINEYYNTGDEGYLDCLDEVTQDWIEKKIGGDYTKFKSDLAISQNNIDTDAGRAADKRRHRDYLSSSDPKEREKAIRHGITSPSQLYDRVLDLKSRARLNTRRRAKQQAKSVKQADTSKGLVLVSGDARKKEGKRQVSNNTAPNSTNTSKVLVPPASFYSKQENIPIPKALTSDETRKKEESKKIASNRKEEKQQAANNTASNSANASKALALVPGQTRTSNHGTTIGKPKRTNNPNHLTVGSPDKPSGSLPPSTVKAMTVANGDNKPFATNHTNTTANTHNNNSGSFLSNHKKAIGLGAAGLVGAALAARKIAALRKQQQKHPGLRGKLQAIINRLKSKLHK